VEPLEPQLAVHVLRPRVLLEHDEPYAVHALAAARILDELPQRFAAGAALLAGDQDALHVEADSGGACIVDDEIARALAVALDDPVLAALPAFDRCEVLRVGPLADEPQVLGGALERGDEREIRGPRRPEPNVNVRSPAT